jgi:hypothetical protein
VAEIAAGMAAASAGRPEVSFDDEPPPRRLAPQATAIAATVEVGEHELGAGKFVLLYDPAGQEGWAGPFRVIAYLRAELEPEIAADQLLGEVGWSWLIEALDLRQARYAAPSGSVTRVVTEGFGTKADEPVATEFEMRASWSPVGERGDSFALDRHVCAWVDALCIACGMPPTPPGVTQLPPPIRGVQGSPPGPTQRGVQGGRSPGPAPPGVQEGRPGSAPHRRSR